MSYTPISRHRVRAGGGLGTLGTVFNATRRTLMTAPSSRLFGLVSASLVLVAGLSGCNTEAPEPTGTQAAAAASQAVRDAVIVTEISTELLLDDRLAKSHFDVDAQAGHVVLLGTASDAAARERASQIVLAVKGVQSLDNRMTVRARG